MMTTPALRVKGHARRVEARVTHGSGMYRSADGYIVSCSCGQWTETVWSTVRVKPAHEAHKAAVLSGEHAAARAAETARRLAAFEPYLAMSDTELAATGFTREQVEGMVAEVKAGDWR